MPPRAPARCTYSTHAIGTCHRRCISRMNTSVFSCSLPVFAKTARTLAGSRPS